MKRKEEKMPGNSNQTALNRKGGGMTEPDNDIGGFLPAIADKSLIQIAEEAEKRADAMNKIRRISLKQTNASDWVDQQNKPYLQVSGAEKIARLFGVSWRISEPVFESLEGGHFSYSYNGEFSLAGATIEAIGSRSSKDGFFKKYKYVGEERVELPPSEIDRGDVKKSAYTNLIGNGITRLLGIRNLTYGDLEEFAGIKREHITSIQYRKGGKPLPDKQPPKPSTPLAPAEPNAPATQAQQQAIHSILGKLKITDDFARHEEVANILKLKSVPTSLSSLTKGQASTVIGTLKAKLNQHGRDTGGDK